MWGGVKWISGEQWSQSPEDLNLVAQVVLPQGQVRRGGRSPGGHGMEGSFSEYLDIAEPFSLNCFLFVLLWLGVWKPLRRNWWAGEIGT